MSGVGRDDNQFDSEGRLAAPPQMMMIFRGFAIRGLSEKLKEFFYRETSLSNDRAESA